MKKIFFTIILLSLVAISFAQELKWFENYDQALKEAKSKKVPILVNFTGSDWCIWCKRLDKEVFSTKEFNSYAKKNLVLLKIDTPKNIKQSDELKKANRALIEQFKIQGFPTIVLVNFDKKEIARTGYQEGGSVKYIEHLKGLIKK